MTLEQRNLLLGFLEISGLNKESKEEQEKLYNLVSEIIDLLPKEHRKKGAKLEIALDEFIAKTKWDYVGYGANLYETIEDWNLNWTPKVVKEITEQDRNVEKKIA